jgi:hypothetical protein
MIFWMENLGKLRFVSPFHYELRTEEKRQGVRNGKYRVFGKVRRYVVHPKILLEKSLRSSKIVKMKVDIYRESASLTLLIFRIRL